MIDNRRIDEILFQFNADKVSAAKTQAEFIKLRKGIVSDIQRIEKESASLATRVNKEFDKLSNQKGIDKLVRDLNKAKRGTEEWEKKLKDLETQLKRVGATEDQIQGVAGNIATAGTGRRRIAAGVGAAAINIRNQAAIQTPLGISTDAIAKIVALFANLPPVTLPVIGILAAVGAGFVALESSLSGSKKALDEATAANTAYFELIGDGATTEDAKKRLEELNAEIKNQSDELATITGAFASGRSGLSDEVDRIQNILGGVKLFDDQTAAGLKFFIGGLANISSADDKLAERANELTKSLADNEAIAARLRAELDKGSFTLNDLRAAEAELNKQREESQRVLDQLAQQRNDLLVREGQQVRDITEERIIADLRELEDWNAQREDQLKKHTDNISAIDEQGQERLVQIRKNGIDKIANIDKRIGELYDDLATVEDDGANKREKINRDYMRDELSELEKFRKDEARRTRDYYKERDRLLQDLNDDLLDAEQENDVNAFIAAQKAAEKELRRNQEDFDQETRDNQEDYLAQRTLEQQQLAERLADIQVEGNARRAEIQERIAEQQAAKAQVIQDIADQLAAERARILQAKIDAQTAFDEARKRDEEAFAKRQQREAEDEARADLKRQNQLNTQLAEIDTKRNAELAALQVVINKVNTLKLLAASIKVSSTGTSTGTNASYTNPIGGQPLQPSPFAFAMGGKIEKPTIALMGERPGYGELLLPYRKSEGAASALNGAGGQSVVINLNGDIGNLTRQEVAAELTKLGQTIVAAKWKARTGAAA